MDKKVLTSAILRYKQDQLNIAQEELAELIQAISKWKRYKNNQARENIIEEIADVTIMLEQLKMMYAIKEEILQDEIDCKIDRLRKRMEEEEKIDCEIGGLIRRMEELGK